ncbi:hypothetical protein Gorai_019751, partial [Gossypium raimondii]|nr:hypothetical protein [Gossypium raimondii]
CSRGPCVPPSSVYGKTDGDHINYHRRRLNINNKKSNSEKTDKSKCNERRIENIPDRKDPTLEMDWRRRREPDLGIFDWGSLRKKKKEKWNNGWVLEITFLGTGIGALNAKMLIGFQLADLISTLVKRWCPKIHTFHLPCGDCTITLEDILMQLGLSVDGIRQSETLDVYFQMIEAYAGDQVQQHANVWCINVSVLNFSTVEWYNANLV